jgi:hypothetical protein
MDVLCASTVGSLMSTKIRLILAQFMYPSCFGKSPVQI